jgi:hypothetical protein
MSRTSTIFPLFKTDQTAWQSFNRDAQICPACSILSDYADVVLNNILKASRYATLKSKISYKATTSTKQSCEVGE